MTRTIFCVALLLSLARCGGGSDNKVQPQTSGTYSLILFSTPWCEPCEALLPKLDAGIAGLGAQREHLNVTLFVVTGAKPFHQPTTEVAAQYKEKLHVSFETQPDPWKWTNYSKFFGSTSLMVPGAVLIDPNGTVVKTYGAGVPIDDQEVITYLKGTL